MKTPILLSFASALLMFTNVSAQSLTPVDPETTVMGTTAVLGTTGELEAAWDVQNISANSITVRARREVISEVSGSTNYFCWGVCFQETTDVSPAGVAVAMPAGAVNSSFYAHYRPHGLAGQTIIKYCFFDMNNTSDEVCHTVYFCVDNECLVGVDETEMQPQISAVYPNPTQGLTSISYRAGANAENVQLVFYNAMGQQVRTENLNAKNGLVLLNTGDFANGVYFYSLVADGTATAPQKLIVNR